MVAGQASGWGQRWGLVIWERAGYNEMEWKLPADPGFQHEHKPVHPHDAR